MKKYILSLFAAVLVFPVASIAQDPHLTQYYASPLSLNPCLTGLFDGQFRIAASNRGQWTNVSNGYKTNTVSIDVPVGQFGIGASVYNQSAGDAGFNNFQAGLSLSYRVVAGTNHFVFGAQGNYIQKSFDSQKAIYDENYNSLVGYDPVNNPTTESYNNTSNQYADFNLGILWFDGNNMHKVNPFIGGSLFHITQPDESFTSNKSALPLKYLGHAGIRIKVGAQVELVPNLLYTYQKQAQELSGGLLAEYRIDHTSTKLQLGVSYRNQDAISIMAGVMFKEFAFGASYGLTPTANNLAVNNRGGFELSIIYIKKRNLIKSKPVCPRI